MVKNNYLIKEAVHSTIQSALPGYNSSTKWQQSLS